MPRVLIIRAPHQASALAEFLRALGIEPVLVSAIEIAPGEPLRPVVVFLQVWSSYFVSRLQRSASGLP